MKSFEFKHKDLHIVVQVKELEQLDAKTRRHSVKVFKPRKLGKLKELKFSRLGQYKYNEEHGYIVHSFANLGLRVDTKLIADDIYCYVEYLHNNPWERREML